MKFHRTDIVKAAEYRHIEDLGIEATTVHKIPPILPLPKGGIIIPSLAKRGRGRFVHCKAYFETVNHISAARDMVSFLFGAFILLLMTCLAIPAHAVQVGISPASSQAAPGDTVTVFVQADQVSDLGGFQFNFSFDPLLLQVNSITVNNGFDQQFKKEFNNTTGQGLVAAFALDNPSVTGTDLPLVEISFTANGLGTANVGLSDVILGKIGGEEIFSSSSGGTVSINPDHIIVASAGEGGNITPSGEVSVNHGVDQSFTITPLEGYAISDLLVDDSSVGIQTSYTFSNVTAGHTISASFVHICNAITLSPASLPAGSVENVYNQTITASNGTGPYGFTISAGSLPDSLLLTTEGLLSGTPTLAGAYSFTVTATDANGCTGTQAYSLTITGATACVPAPSGLVAWWPGNGNANDVINGNNGTLNGGMEYDASGRVGQAFSFDGVNDYISVPDSSLWAFGTNDFSIDLWTKFNSVRSGLHGQLPNVFVGQDESGGSHKKWVFYLADDGLGFHINGTATTSIGLVPFSPIAGQWYHLAVTRSGNTYSFFVNGSLTGSAADSTVIPDVNAPLTIGQAEGLGYFNGLIDEVQIYNRALDVSEIMAVYNAGGFGICGDTALPSVTGTTPTNNATGVALNTSITATFSEDIDASTITADTFNVNNGAVSGTVSYEPETRTATFTVPGSLSYSTTYTVSLTEGVKDLSGNALTPYSWSFTTADQPQYSLTVSRPVSGGTISAPGLICAGISCTGTYVENTVVALSVIPQPGYIFTGWSGACTGTGQCNLSMTEPRSVSANFYRTLAPLAYVTTGGAVSVIDTSTNNVVADIPVSGGQSYGVAVNPAGTKVYVGFMSGGSSIAVINTATNMVEETINIGSETYGIAVNPTGSKLYAGLHNSDKVSVMDTVSNVQIASITVGNSPSGIVINPAGTRMYVANLADNSLSVVDLGSDTVIATVPVGTLPEGVAINPAGTRVYVANASSKTISVLDTGSNTVIATVDVQDYPYGIAVDPSGRNVFVANYMSDSVSVIDAVSNTVTATMEGIASPVGIAINPAGTSLFVANSHGNTVSSIDAWNDVLVESIAIDGLPVAYGKFIGPNPNQCAPEPSGLLAWWTGDGDANDIVGGNNGTLMNGAATVPGMVWRAFSFNGVDQYVEKLSPGGALNIGNQSWAISSWVKTSYAGANAQYIVSRYQCGWDCSEQPNAGALYDLHINGSGNAGFSVRQTAGGTSFGTDNVLTVSDSTNVRDGQWHLLTGVLDRNAAEVRIFVDGQLKNSATAVGLGPIDDTGSPLEIGRYFRQGWGTPDFYFNGLIDEVQIYNRALSSSEIASLYNAGSSGVCGIPDITVSPVSKNFGNVNVNTTSEKQTFTFTNGGNADLHVTSGQLQGDSVMFNVALGGPGQCPTPPFIAPAGSSCTLDVSFRPGSEGSKSAALRIISDDPNMPNLDIPLSGNGVKQNASVTLSNLTQTYDGTQKSVTVTTVPANLNVYIEYNSSPALPVIAGSYTVVAVINDTAYQGSTGGTMVIDPKPIIVTADAKSRVYGAADPALTYQTNADLVAGDGFTGVLSRTAGENVGSYAINQGTLALSGNYNLTYVGANLSITPKPITVTADAKSKVYGAGDPALTYQTNVSLVGSDAFTGALTRTTGENVGSYPLLQGTLALSGNYSLTYVGANLTISKANQSVGTVSFTASTVSTGGTTNVSATASSGLPVTFSSQTTGICTVSGSTVTGVSAGTCTIQASQAGNSNYNAAASVTGAIEIKSTYMYSINKTVNGYVTSTPAGLVCPVGVTVCAAEFPVSGSVKLSFKPAMGKKVLSVWVNGINYGPIKSLTLKKMKKPPVIEVIFSN